MNSLVSVIIPTFKRPYKTLSRAINSVLNQSYTNMEIIIVDDSPKDDFNRKEVEENLKIISDKRVRYIQHQYNQGACIARNTGINNSRGDYIAFLDDDDEWLPDKLQLQLKKIKNSDAGLIYCSSYTITLKDNRQVNKTVRFSKISGWAYNRLIIDNFIGSTSFVLLKKEVIDSCGVFNNDLLSAQDYELWLRISKKFQIDFVDTPLVNYYIHEGERISTNIDYKIKGLEKLNELNMEYLVSNPKAMAIRKLKITPYYAVKYGYKSAFLKLFQAARVYPFQIENIKYILTLFKTMIKGYYN